MCKSCSTSISPLHVEENRGEQSQEHPSVSSRTGITAVEHLGTVAGGQPLLTCQRTHRVHTRHSNTARMPPTFQNIIQMHLPKKPSALRVPGISLLSILCCERFFLSGELKSHYGIFLVHCVEVPRFSLACFLGGNSKKDRLGGAAICEQTEGKQC